MSDMKLDVFSVKLVILLDYAVNLIFVLGKLIIHHFKIIMILLHVFTM